MKAQPLQTVPNVDLTKYVGKWFEIASFPQQVSKRLSLHNCRIHGNR